ncbi:hypothetical protein B0H15DRAFT_845780 [Mycena belliarum]|uniref:Uncharacterized protein n=1 Tax=Mycena belliarum TaxID=1033014 RepID=A0AAD6XT64_9AGAR|nr:hypothetical protein B0H15DRAFT_845780 [Mycena belliae]
MIKVTTTPLSALSATDIAFDEDGIIIWDILLAAEQVMIQESQTSQFKSRLVGIRVVGHFLCEFWKARENLLVGGLKPYQTLLKQIKSCQALPSSTASQEELVACYTAISDLGIHYQKHLIRAFRSDGDSDGGSPPQKSEHPTPPSMDALVSDIVQQLKEADHSKFSSQRPALARDGYKCVVSGNIDYYSYDAFPTAFPANTTTQAYVGF